MGRERKYLPLSGEDIEWVIMFINNLKYVLKTKRSSLIEICQKLNMTYYEMKKYLDGTIKPDEEMIRRIAQAADCTVDDLTDETYCPWNYGLSEEEIAKKGKRFN